MKAARERGTFLSATMEARKKRTVKILYPMKIFFRNDGEINTFSDEVKARDFIANRPAVK